MMQKLYALVRCCKPSAATHSAQVNGQCIGDNVDALNNHEVLMPGQLYGMLLKVHFPARFV